MTALMALAVSYAVYGSPFTVRAAEWFIGFSMTVLALLKLQNVESFATMFLNYDLLAKRWVPYSYIYPVAEGAAGVLMIAGALNWLSIPLALLIGTVGAVSVFKAVYVDRRQLKCACVGGSSNVPLGFVSLTENVMMVAMALWMLAAVVGSGATHATLATGHAGHAASPAAQGPGSVLGLRVLAEPVALARERLGGTAHPRPFRPFHFGFAPPSPAVERGKGRAGAGPVGMRISRLWGPISSSSGLRARVAPAPALPAGRLAERP
jgi:hypothetical protein